MPIPMGVPPSFLTGVSPSFPMGVSHPILDGIPPPPGIVSTWTGYAARRKPVVVSRKRTFLFLIEFILKSKQYKMTTLSYFCFTKRGVGIGGGQVYRSHGYHSEPV